MAINHHGSPNSNAHQSLPSPAIEPLEYMPRQSSISHEQKNVVVSSNSVCSCLSSPPESTDTTSEQVLRNTAINSELFETNNLREGEVNTTHHELPKIDITYQNGIVLKVTYHHS